MAARRAPLAVGLLLMALVMTCHGISKEEEQDLSLSDAGVEPLDDGIFLDTGATFGGDGDDKLDKPKINTVPPLDMSTKPDTTNLQQQVRTRTVKRLESEKAEAAEDLANSKAEFDQAKQHSEKVQLHLKKLDKLYLESKAAKEAARKEVHDAGRATWEQHLKVREARKALKEAKKGVAYERETRQEMGVQLQVLAANRDVGDSNIKLNKAKKIRDRQNSKYDTMKAKQAAMDAKLKKAEETRDAAKQGLKDARTKRKALRKAYTKQVGKYSMLKFQAKQYRRQQRSQKILVAGADGQLKAAEEVFKQSQQRMSAIESKIASSQDNAKTLKTEKLREEAAVGEAKDEDGLSTSGKPLVAPKGSIAAMYMKMFAKYRLPEDSDDVTRDPVLAAQSKAALNDDATKAAEKTLQAKGTSGNGAKLTTKLETAKAGVTY